MIDIREQCPISCLAHENKDYTCNKLQCLKHRAYEQGREDRETEIIENINSYTDILIKALNDKEENPILHEGLASARASEIRVRKLIVEQLKERSDG